MATVGRTDCEAINKPNRVRSGAFRARLAARFGSLGEQVPDSVRIFVSTVSDEFRAYRDQLRGDLTRPNVEVKVQEDFKDLGGVTLENLDDYIKLCDAVVHLVGDMTGAAAGEVLTKAILDRYEDLSQRFPQLGKALAKGDAISYTQWEAWLALYHKKVLLIAQADTAAPRGPAYRSTEETRAAQQAHLKRLRDVERYPYKQKFTSPDNLAKQIAYTTILDLLAKAPSSPECPGILWSGEDQPPKEAEPGDILIGDRVKVSDLKEGYFAPRPVFGQLADKAEKWIESARGNPAARRKLSLFWIGGRSGTGKSIALLHVLASLHAKENNRVVIWLDSNIDALPEGGR